MRPYWKGYLKLALVSCPIALHAACSTAERVALRQVNKATGNRLRQLLIDEETREPVAPEHKGRGYEVAKGQYLIRDDARALLLARPGIELRHARFRSVLAAKPDRPTLQEIADHDPIGMTFADRNLVYPNREWPRCARTCELRLHVLHIQRFDRVPIKCQFLRNVRDRRLPTAASDKIGKALGVAGIVAQELQPSAWCRGDCRPETPAAPFSPCHNCGSQRVA